MYYGYYGYFTTCNDVDLISQKLTMILCVLCQLETSHDRHLTGQVNELMKQLDAASAKLGLYH